MILVGKIPVALVLILTVVLPSVCFFPAVGSTTSTVGDVPFFGVTFGGNTTSEAKLLIDKVKGYTNLFVVASWDIAMNETALTEICQYAFNANLYFIVYFGFILLDSAHNGTLLSQFEQASVDPFHIPWLTSAQDRWGEKFLGAYVSDEPGGKQIDVGHFSGYTTVRAGSYQVTFENVSSYSDAANRFEEGVNFYFRTLNNASYIGSIPNATGKIIPVFTSDNALYWFDYLAGYNTVFAEFGWNHNEAQHIALCRGAANVQGKDWGAIVTWATNDSPYLANGTQMIQELDEACVAGAKYLIVLNYPQINPYGALSDEHFKAMEEFWNQIHTSPRKPTDARDRVALVLPKDYGWGMRQPNDKIWGLWQADDLSPQIGAKVASLIHQYGTNLDIIYDDPNFNYTVKYSTIYYWNGTTLHSPQSLSNASMPSELYISLVIVALALICVPSYLIVRNRKRNSPRV